MTWMFIISTTVWVNGWDTSSVASRARSELTSSQFNWKGNRKGKGTDETPHYLVFTIELPIVDCAIITKVSCSMGALLTSTWIFLQLHCKWFVYAEFILQYQENWKKKEIGVLLPKLIWPTVRKIMFIFEPI